MCYMCCYLSSEKWSRKWRHFSGILSISFSSICIQLLNRRYQVFIIRLSVSANSPGHIINHSHESGILIGLDLLNSLVASVVDEGGLLANVRGVLLELLVHDSLAESLGFSGLSSGLLGGWIGALMEVLRVICKTKLLLHIWVNCGLSRCFALQVLSWSFGSCILFPGLFCPCHLLGIMLAKFLKLFKIIMAK